MGGHYSTHLAYSSLTQIAGVFVFSTFINFDSPVYDHLADIQSSSTTHLPNLLWIHGDDDDLLLHEWGVYCFKELTRLGVRGEFHTMNGSKHEIRMAELLKLEEWARKLLLPLADDLLHKL